MALPAHRSRRNQWAAALLVGGSLAAHTQAADSVTWTGRMGSRVLLVVDGQPRTLGAGESFQGVRVVSVGEETVTVDNAGQRQQLSLGGPARLLSPAPNASGAEGGRRVSIPIDADSHARTQGSINGRSVTFLVDTGATLVTLSAQQADAIGLSYKQSPQVSIQTANGTAPAWRVSLDRVRLGQVELYRIDALVVQQELPVVLLGNSVLSRFEMRREAGLMVLTRRF